MKIFKSYNKQHIIKWNHKRIFGASEKKTKYFPSDLAVIDTMIIHPTPVSELLDVATALDNSFALGKQDKQLLISNCSHLHSPFQSTKASTILDRCTRTSKEHASITSQKSWKKKKTLHSSNRKTDANYLNVNLLTQPMLMPKSINPASW